MPICLNLRLTEGTDPVCTDPIRWAAMDVPLIMVDEDMRLLRESYRIPDVSALTPIFLKDPMHVQLGTDADHVPTEEAFEEERQGEGAWLVLFLPLVTDCPSFVKQWKESWFWVTGNCHRITDNLELDLDVPYVYGIATEWGLDRRYGFLLDRQCCLVKLGLMASKAEMDQGVRPRPTMALLASRKPNSLAPGSSEDSKQKKVIEELSREGNKGEAGSAGEDLVSHGDLEDALEASLAAVVRTTGMQLKKLDDANTVQKVTVEALEAANEEKKCLLEELSLHRVEAKGLRRSLEASEKSRKDAEAEIVRLLDQKKEMEKMIESVEADYVANFHNTEGYTNFFDYFAKMGHQEVLAALRSEHPDSSISSLEARFPPPDDGDDC
ncbi:hypothetical protein Adt_23466 [Abeliophyllum distichum]|uniref:Uncharacterized protein n=1 Tax=Abeliophyllum distichum TaxID=126358 RepID=A0ABD1SAY0_9LAMI